MITVDRNDPNLNEVKENGQNKAYLVLSEEERAKGFVRPIRDSYVHLGKEIEQEEGTIQELIEGVTDCSDWARSYYTIENGYVAYLKYPEEKSPLVGRFIKEEELKNIKEKRKFIEGCGAVTKMNQALAETYARNPKFYGATFCVGCKEHLPVDEFVWEGTNEKVGS